MHVRLYRLGFVGALTSVVSLSFMPMFMMPTARAADVGIDIGDVRIPPTPMQEFFGFHNALYQQLFGHHAVIATPFYHTLEAVAAPGVYLGFTEDGDLFIFDVEAVLDAGVAGEEVYPGVTATVGGVCSGTLIWQDWVEVEAIVASLEIDGATDHVLLALWDVDTTPDEGPWGWMYELLRGSSGGEAAHAAGGDPCSDPTDPDECLFYCPDLTCPDGAQFCPMCDPVMRAESCEIESDFRDCISAARAASRNHALGTIFWFGLGWAGCALLGGPAGMLLCALNMGGIFVAVHNGTQGWKHDWAACSSHREDRYDAMFAGFCSESEQ